MSIGHISFLDKCKQTWGQKAELEGNRKPDQLTGKNSMGCQISKMGISEEARGHA